MFGANVFRGKRNLLRHCEVKGQRSITRPLENKQFCTAMYTIALHGCTYLLFREVQAQSDELMHGHVLLKLMITFCFPSRNVTIREV